VETFDPGSTTHAAVFSCSPRPAGNSDLAAQLFGQGVVQAEGQVQPVLLRQFKVLPCVGCHRCEHDTSRRCFLTKKDQSGPIFTLLQRAPLVFFSSPIYFYHLPATFKAFIDRGQSYYLRLRDNDPTLASLPRRKVYTTLIAGREKGEKTFEGSLLTLKYFLAPFQLDLAEPLLLRGLDLPSALARDDELRSRVVAYGEAAWRETLASRAGQGCP